MFDLLMAVGYLTKTVDLNVCISMHDGIFVIVLIILYIQDLVLSEDSCKDRQFGTEK